MVKVQHRWRNQARFLGPGRFQGERDWDDRYCEIRYHFIRDLRINNTSKTLQMGTKGASLGI